MVVAPLLLAAATAVHVLLPRGFRPTSLATADFNGDTKADVALCGENQQLLVFAGDGRGGLRAIPQQARCGATPSAMVAADVNGDHRPDLAVANHETDHVTVLQNDGNGHFTARTLAVHSKPHPHMIAAADVNEDGHVDLITDSTSEKRLTLLLADGRGGWRTPGTPIEIGRRPYWNVIAADLDGDGHVDLVMPNYGSDTVCILFGDGRGHFAHAAQSPISAGPTPFTVAVGDVNGDGRRDVVVANYSGHISDTSRDGLTWVRNDGRRRFTAFPQPVVAGRYSARLVVGDVNGDGINDVAFSNSAAANIAIVYGSRSGLQRGTSVPTMPSPHALALADLNGDSRADLLVVSEERNELMVLLSR